MKMAVYSGIGVIFDVRLIGKDEPPILLKPVCFIGKWYGEGRQNFRVLPQKVFPVALLELFDKSSDIVINQSHNPLNDMEGVYNRYSIWKIFLNISDVLVIHI